MAGGWVSAWVLRTMGPQNQWIPPICPLTLKSLSRCPLTGLFQAPNTKLPPSTNPYSDLSPWDLSPDLGGEEAVMGWPRPWPRPVVTRPGSHSQGQRLTYRSSSLCQATRPTLIWNFLGPHLVSTGSGFVGKGVVTEVQSRRAGEWCEGKDLAGSPSANPGSCPGPRETISEGPWVPPHPKRGPIS